MHPTGWLNLPIIAATQHWFGDLHARSPNRSNHAPMSPIIMERLFLLKGKITGSDARLAKPFGIWGYVTLLMSQGQGSLY